MKTLKILKLTSVILLGMVLTSQVEVVGRTPGIKEKKAIVLAIEKPIEELIAKVAARFDNEDLATIDRSLESWMFDAGYLNIANEAELVVPVPWLENMSFTTESEDLTEVPVPWLENMHFTTESEDVNEVPVPWLENLHFTAPTVTENDDVTEVPVLWLENLHFD
jgi:hypothetical protein